MSKRIDWKKRYLRHSAALSETITNLMSKNAKLKQEIKRLKALKVHRTYRPDKGAR